MDSTRTKATRPSCIKPRSQSTALVSSTAKVSAASKSTSTLFKEIHPAHQRGLECETQVIRYYQKKNYHLLKQRLKTPFAEIDLIFRTPQGRLLMVEVKSARSADFLPHRMSARQKERQARALVFLCEHFKTEVEAHWAFVTGNGDIVVIEDISG